MKTYFCWRCNRDMPFLDEAEWQQVAPLLAGAIQAIKDYRVEHRCDLQTARQRCKPQAMMTFEELTGMPGVHFDTIYHHRLLDWGPECPQCGHLLRTSKARHCANCGLERTQNQ